MAETILKGREVAEGRAFGDALTSYPPISLMAGVNSDIRLLVFLSQRLKESRRQGEG